MIQFGRLLWILLIAIQSKKVWGEDDCIDISFSFTAVITIDVEGNPTCSTTHQWLAGAELNKIFDNAMENVVLQDVKITLAGEEKTGDVSIKESNTKICERATSEVNPTNAPVAPPVQAPVTAPAQSPTGGRFLRALRDNTVEKEFEGNDEEIGKEATVYRFLESAWTNDCSCYTYRGTGSCRLCYHDSCDKRMLTSHSQEDRNLQLSRFKSLVEQTKDETETNTGGGSTSTSETLVGNNGDVSWEQTSEGEDHTTATKVESKDGEITSSSFSFTSSSATSDDLILELEAALNSYLSFHMRLFASNNSNHCFHKRHVEVKVDLTRVDELPPPPC